MISDERFVDNAEFFAGERAGVLPVQISFATEGVMLRSEDGKRRIWQWRKLRALQDQAAQDMLVLGQTDDLVARLYVRDASLIAQVVERAPKLRKNAEPTPVGQIVKWASAALASVALIIFVLVPIMAAQLADVLPTEGEKALGDTTLAQIRTALGETTVGGRISTCSNAAGQEALQAMYDRLNPDADLPYPVEIHVFDHELVNAFALPGGHLVLFQGLIDGAEGADEVAAVLAHELGHVVYRDPTRGALRSAGSLGVLGLLFGDFAGGTAMLFLANQLINATYSQAAEARADDYAHGLLDRANLSPAAIGTFFQRLKDEGHEIEGVYAHFASHPAMQARIDASKAAVDDGRSYGAVLTDDQWRDLRGICGGKKSRKNK